MGDRQKIVAFDLDDTLCVRDSEEGGVKKYLTSKPIPEMLEICNQCYDEGYFIVIYTARGMYYFDGRKDDIYDELYELTKSQLRDWGIKHHRLVMGKVHYDLLVDDKASNIRDIISLDDVKEALGV